MKKINCYGISFILFCCIACSDESHHENYRSLANEIWERDSNYKFNIHITEPGIYRVSACIRHTTDYKQKNLSCYLTISNPNIPEFSDTIEVIIANENGEWVGQGLGGLKTVIQPLKQVFHFDSTGIYNLELKHRMKEKHLEGIKNVGVRITKLKK